MDVTALLGWLTLAVALNTTVTAFLAVLVVRPFLGSSRADPRPRAIAAPARAALGPAPGDATPGSDPLAGAIEAFLGRSDGLFRAGGPSAAQLAGSGGSPRWAAALAAPSAASTYAPAPPSPPAPPVATSPAVATGPPSRPGSLSPQDRAQSEVTWATSRPSRFVPSGPHPAPLADAAGPDPMGPEALPTSAALARAGRSVSRVSIALSARDVSGAGADARAVARLGPVIGGFIRERTRAIDSVTGLTGGRYSVILPDTSLDGAAAFIQRLTQSCDAWLAAEQPPLRLEFGLVDLPSYAMAGGAATTRASGPERRRTVSPGT